MPHPESLVRILDHVDCLVHALRLRWLGRRPLSLRHCALAALLLIGG